VTYREVLDRLFAARRGGIVLGLERMTPILERLGDPHRRLGAIAHVGGTNGKGSTVAMIAAIASAAGRRVGVYTSPHLGTLRERFVMAGKMITEAELVEAAEAVWAAGGDALTFFEQLTAMALWWLAAQRPELTVLEVGLGGRLDATSVVDATVAAVTGVAMDHEAILGATLAKIAAEKAGIFRRGGRAVIGASGEPEGVALLVDGARAAGVARLTVVGAHRPEVALRGAHQQRNAACALAVIDHLEAACALDAPWHVRARGLAAVVQPGRYERVGRVILDGAHNPQGARALAEALAAEPRPRTLILAVSADKDVAAMVAPLAAAVDTVIATRYQQERAMEPAALAAMIPGARAAPDLTAALAMADGATVIIAGSLMLVGEARVLLLGAPADPFAVTDPAPRP